MTTLAGFAVAPEVPNWDWKATFVYDSGGNITSRTLNSNSTYWLDCTLALVQISNTNTTTSNQTHMEQVLIDTTNKLTGSIVQLNGNINEKRYSCVGGQINLPNNPGDGPHSCYVPVLGIYCSFSCTVGETVYVDVSAGYAPLGGDLYGICGGASAVCYPETNLHCTGDSSPQTVSTNTTGFNNCFVHGIGIWPVAKCSAS